MRKITLSLLTAATLVATMAIPAYAQTTKPPKTVNVACVATAVDTRESAIIAAYQARGTAVTQALQNRQTALKNAWAMTDAKARNAAIRAAWKNYQTDFKAANTTFRKARMDAWTAFNTARKACGPNSQTSDSGTMGLDNQL